MTTFDRFDRDLPLVLEDLYGGPTPAYRDDILSQTQRMPQRPGWTFPERWLPMSVLTERMATAPRVPLRLIAVALLIIALVAAIVYVGSQQPRLPKPFGVANNGLMSYSANGDIYVGDPTTGRSNPIVTGLDRDIEPIFSRDGSKVAFRRVVSATDETFDFFVVNPDGTGLTKLTTEPIRHGFWDWSGDTKSLVMVVGTEDGDQLVSLDATEAAAPRVLASNIAGDAAIRPPRGDQILFRRGDDASAALFVVNADGSSERLVVGPIHRTKETDAWGQLQWPSWAPDGSMIAFARVPDGGTESRVFLANADGSAIRQLTVEPGEPGGLEPQMALDPLDVPTWWEGRPIWSPDGTRIAFERWFSPKPWTGDHWTALPIGVARLDDGIVTDAGPAPPGGGAFTIEWSPDGTRILAIPNYYDRGMPANIIDPTTGAVETVQWTVDETWPSWQRVAGD
jgi:Tol biopolymer transport system component